MNDWKDLDSETPLSVVSDDKYEIGKYIGTGIQVIEKLDLEDKMRIFERFIDGIALFYRLKPLEPIRITKEELTVLCNFYDLMVSVDRYRTFTGRQVEIID